MRRLVAHWRKIYDERYRDVRHMVFAHKRRNETVQTVLAKTNIDELKNLFGFLAGLYEALDGLHLNGHSRSSMCGSLHCHRKREGHRCRPASASIWKAMRF
jgi:hypothetical protein